MERNDGRGRTTHRLSEIRKHELFEYRGHAACLLPLSLYPLMRYRMDAEETQEYMRTDRGAYMAAVYAEVVEHGPIAVSELSNPGKRSGNWWGWGVGKAALEHLYRSGLVAIAGRRGFERLYDIAERVIPRAALDAKRSRTSELVSFPVLFCEAFVASLYGLRTVGS